MVLSGISPEITATYRGKTPRLANEEVIIEKEHARDYRESLSIIRRCMNMVEEGLRDGRTVEDLCGVLMSIRN